ncbi:MAG TPA: DMT family transporter [Acidimicrobiales bacterium]|nr:DMT family transporter [Acidimicrobiales bacterium]
MSRRGAVLFASMCVIWGLPYLLIKVSVRHLEPATLVFCRTAIGSLILVPIAAARGELRPLVAGWRWIVVYTVVELGIPWVLLSTAEQRLPSSLSGLLVAAVPLVGAALSWSLGAHDPLGGRGLAGLLVGLAGVGALVGFDVSGGDAGSVGLIAVVVVGYALGPIVLARRLAALPSLGVVAASLVLCSAVYAPFALTHLPSTAPPARVTAAVVVLGVVCTALAFVLFLHLIAEIGPVRATVITYVNPAVAVVLGVAFLHEHFGIGTAIGFVLILLGSSLATRARRSGPVLAEVAEP